MEEIEEIMEHYKLSDPMKAVLREAIEEYGFKKYEEGAYQESYSAAMARDGE